MAEPTYRSKYLNWQRVIDPSSAPSYEESLDGLGFNMSQPTQSVIDQPNWQRAIDPSSSPSYRQSLEELGFNEGRLGLMDRLKGGLQNEGLMKGILGAGQLGLGLMSYLNQSKVANEQLKALRQNRQQSAANFRAQEQQRAAINSGFSSALS